MRTDFTFTSILETVHFNVVSTAVFLPHHIIVHLPKGRLRVSGLINGAPFSLAIQYRKDGSRYFTVGAALRKAARISPGDTVYVSFKVLDLNHVELPEAFELTVRSSIETGKLFHLPSGSKQILSSYINEVKNIDSRIRHAVQIVQKAKTGLLQPQQKRKNK